MKDHYTQEIPYRFLNVASYFFLPTTPFHRDVDGQFKKLKMEVLSTGSAPEEGKWGQLKSKIETIKISFGIKDEILVARSFSERSVPYRISGNVILVNEKKAFDRLTEKMQDF